MFYFKHEESIDRVTKHCWKAFDQAELNWFIKVHIKTKSNKSPFL